MRFRFIALPQVYLDITLIALPGFYPNKIITIIPTLHWGKYSINNLTVFYVLCIKIIEMLHKMFIESILHFFLGIPTHWWNTSQSFNQSIRLRMLHFRQEFMANRALRGLSRQKYQTVQRITYVWMPNLLDFLAQADYIGTTFSKFATGHWMQNVIYPHLMGLGKYQTKLKVSAITLKTETSSV